MCNVMHRLLKLRKHIECFETTIHDSQKLYSTPKLPFGTEAQFWTLILSFATELMNITLTVSFLDRTTFCLTLISNLHFTLSSLKIAARFLIIF